MMFSKKWMIMGLTKFAVIAVGFVLFVPASVWGMIASNLSGNTLFASEDKSFSLSFGASLNVESGNMIYTIRKKGSFKSELEWPLDNIYMGGIVSASFWERLQINAGAWKSLDDDAGTMKNTDWFDNLSAMLFEIYGDDRAVYGEFDTTVDAAQFDVNLRYDGLRRSNIALGVMLGYAYTKWKWETGDGYQISPLRAYNIGNVSGVGIVYEQEIQVPYLGLAVSLSPKHSSFEFNMYTLYSPIARCDDVDDHVQRYKKSTGDTEGTFFSLGGDVLWNFRGSWSLIGRINYTLYDLDGYQGQYFYGGDDPPPGTRYENIDMTVEGRQLYFGFMLSYKL